LVGEEEPRPVGERRADGDSLLFAAGELGRSRAALVSEADTVEELVGPRQALSPGNAAQAERQRDELACGELGGERERVVLVGVAERARSVRGEPAGREPCQIRAEDPDGAGGR